MSVRQTSDERRMVMRLTQSRLVAAILLLAAAPLAAEAQTSPQVPRWSYPGSVDGELLSRSSLHHSRGGY